MCLGSEMAGGVREASSLTRLASGAGFGWDLSGGSCQNSTQSNFMWSEVPPSMAAGFQEPAALESQTNTASLLPPSVH